MALTDASAIEGVVARLEPGGRLAALRPLTGGVSAEVLGLVIATAAGGARRVVFRRHRADHVKDHGAGIAAKEHGLLTALHGEGLAVPEPYLYDDDGAAGPYLVIEWVEGSTDVAAADLPGAIEQMARFLVELHALDLSSLPLPALEPIEDPRVAIGAYLPPTEAGERARAALGSGALDHEPNTAVLLHGDYWPGNVLWQGGRLAAVIDWEDACLGDPLADLATTRAELLCRYGAEAMERFTDRYLDLAGEAGRPPRLGPLPLWELYVSAAALATMATWGLAPDEEAERRRRTEGFFERAARALG